jgi:type IV secretion system protein VirD4
LTSAVFTTDATHWSKRAAALLAAVLHAAALAGRDVDATVGWVLSHEFDEPGAILEAADAGLACGLLRGLVNTEARERSSICSAAADALDAYSSHAALAAACDPNFDPDVFVREGGTVYVHAPGELQVMAAPLICGLLSEIRRATYQAARELRVSCIAESESHFGVSTGVWSCCRPKPQDRL